MAEPLTRDDRIRWAIVARRTHELGATSIVRRAIENRPIPLDALHAAERALDELDAIPGEPEPLDVNP